MTSVWTSEPDPRSARPASDYPGGPHRIGLTCIDADEVATIAGVVAFASAAAMPIGYRLAADQHGRIAAAIRDIEPDPDRLLVYLDQAVRPEQLRRQVDDVLTRLAVDRFRLLVLSEPSPELVRAAGRLVETGLVSGLGVSVADAGSVHRAQAEHPLEAVALTFSLLETAALNELIPATRSIGAKPLIRGPLAGGLLTGNPREPALAWAIRLLGSSEGVQIGMARLHRLATTRQVGAARLALAWILTTLPDAFVLVRTLVPTHVEMNLSAGGLSLTDTEQRRLQGLFG